MTHIEKFSVLEVERELGEGGGETRWPSDRFAHDGRDASELRQKITFLSEPKQMMLLKPDGSDKHARHFWLESHGHTVCWSKKAGSGGKKRSLVDLAQAADCVIFHTGGPAPTSSSGSSFGFGSSSTVDDGGEGGEVVQARMESEEAAARYVEAGKVALQDRMAQVSFTDIDGEELAHTILLPQSTTLAEAKEKIAETLTAWAGRGKPTGDAAAGSDPSDAIEADAFHLHTFAGTHEPAHSKKTAVDGYRLVHVEGPGPDYGLSNMLSAVEKITELGLDLSGRAVDAWIKANPTGERSSDRKYDPNTVRIWNLTKHTVQVDRLTSMGYNRSPKMVKWHRFAPGYETMAVNQFGGSEDRGHSLADSLKGRCLTWETFRSSRHGPKNVYDQMDDASFNKAGIEWQAGVVELEDSPRNIQNAHLKSTIWIKKWNISDKPKQNIFVEGDGDDTTLGAPRLVFSLKKNWLHTAGTKKVTTSTGKRLAKGHHMVPIHRYLGSSSDASEYLFDLEVDEKALVSDMKQQLAEKLREVEGYEAAVRQRCFLSIPSLADGLAQNASPFQDGAKLRVRELPSGTFAGEVFPDDVAVIKPVTKFYGSERFAFTMLEGPETKLNEKQVRLSLQLTHGCNCLQLVHSLGCSDPNFD